VYAYYSNVAKKVRVSKSQGLDSTLSAEGGKVRTKLRNTEKRTNVKILQYIRNRLKDDGYTCLRCLYINCKNKYPCWDQIERELNRLLVGNGIFIRADPVFSTDDGAQYAFLTAS